MKKIAIITGTSRGLGKSLALLFLEAGYTVIGISRNNEIKHTEFHFLKLDLETVKNLNVKVETFLKKKNISNKAEHIVLINNAATVLPINEVHKAKESEVIRSYFLNLHAPIILSQFVIKKFLQHSSHLTICNISSGAANRALENWSFYCTMKGGLKMFTDCLSVDYKVSKNFKAFSYYPGVMDTQMQQTIRQQPRENFKNVGQFIQLKKTNHLLNPLVVAKNIFDIVSRPQKITQLEYNIADLKR